MIRLIGIAEVERAEAAEEGRAVAAVANLGELDVGHHVRAPPQSREEEHREHAAHQHVPPQPVAGDAIRRDDTGDDERRVGGERRRDHRRAGEPPRHIAARDEILLEAFAAALRVQQPDSGRQAEIGDDNQPVDRGQVHGLRREGLGPEARSAVITASASCRRTAVILVLLRVGLTRLLRRMTNTLFTGSIAIDVPVNPVCPNAACDMNCPAHAADGFVYRIPGRSGFCHPIARFENAESVYAVNSAIVARLKDSHAVERAVVQVHPREASHVVRAAEHAGVRRHAAEVVRALVVYLAANETAAPRIDFRRRDAGSSDAGGRYIVSVIRSGSNTWSCRYASSV